MKKLIAAACLGALAAAAASPAGAQEYRQPMTPIEALFGAVLGVPAALAAPRSGRSGAVAARQGYEADWGFSRSAGFAPLRVERRDFAWPGFGGRQVQRVARATPEQSIDPRYRRQTVAYDGAEAPGTIVVDTGSRFLYLVQEDGTALRYGIGVGREGFEWSGTASIGRKAEWPDWHPPAEMRAREPWLPERMEGGPENPLGARALYLYQGEKDTLYRIHGTNQPHTIGQAVSSGCIRMLNDDVADLYERVGAGTRVIVI